MFQHMVMCLSSDVDGHHLGSRSQKHFLAYENRTEADSELFADYYSAPDFVRSLSLVIG